VVYWIQWRVHRPRRTSVNQERVSMKKNNRSEKETDLECILGMIHLNFQPPPNMPNPMSRVLRKRGIRGRLDRGDACEEDSDEERKERLLN
jgi:hypothetical protein